MKLKFDDKAVKQFYKETCKMDGKKKKIDTPLEKDRLANYLANNQDNMSVNDIAIFDKCIQNGLRGNLPSEPVVKPLSQEHVKLKGVNLNINKDDN